ncbi:hypothetical protein AYI69_g4909 [Smittium culicis]|uniref:Uncharacterized protein n=1 Tax=Smittium culicis TaxID=133412 RepID=A0A1R1Y9K2_9FUNG|nr:hypothetical protein AYI69_g4909 [Smittium culicis]
MINTFKNKLLNKKKNISNKSEIEYDSSESIFNDDDSSRHSLEFYEADFNFDYKASFLVSGVSSLFKRKSKQRKNTKISNNSKGFYNHNKSGLSLSDFTQISKANAETLPKSRKSSTRIYNPLSKNRKIAIGDSASLINCNIEYNSDQIDFQNFNNYKSEFDISYIENEKERGYENDLSSSLSTLKQSTTPDSLNGAQPSHKTYNLVDSLRKTPFFPIRLKRNTFSPSSSFINHSSYIPSGLKNNSGFSTASISDAISDKSNVGVEDCSSMDILEIKSSRASDLIDPQDVNLFNPLLKVLPNSSPNSKLKPLNTTGIDVPEPSLYSQDFVLINNTFSNLADDKDDSDSFSILKTNSTSNFYNTNNIYYDSPIMKISSYSLPDDIHSSSHIPASNNRYSFDTSTLFGLSSPIEPFLPSTKLNINHYDQFESTLDLIDFFPQVPNKTPFNIVCERYR